jgi:methionyl-tRNA formyltransferase
MGKSVMKHIILSEKSWNVSLPALLKEEGITDEIHLIQSKSDFTLTTLRRIKPDFIFVVHWSYIIPDEIFNEFECIVFHMTDVPFGRGGSPLQNLISRQIYNTKLSALRVVKQLDAGPVYIKKNLNLNGSAEEIYLRANSVMVSMIINIILNKPEPIPQYGEPTVFKRRTPEMSEIRGLETIKNLFDHIRMLDADGYPKAYLNTEQFVFEFSRAGLKADDSIIADVKITKK